MCVLGGVVPQDAKHFRHFESAILDEMTSQTTLDTQREDLVGNIDRSHSISWRLGT